MKRILLIGANSYVAKSLVNSLSEKYEVIGTYNKKANPILKNQEKLNIAQRDEVASILAKSKPDIAIITAGISTDSAPKEIIRSVNVEGVRNIVSSLPKTTYLVFFSTEQVFSGAKKSYLEKDTPEPINEYGRSKRDAEVIVQNHKNHLILRLGPVQGPKESDDHDNFTSRFLRENFTVFSDVYRRPIAVQDIGAIVKKLIEKQVQGIVHVTGDELLTYEQMAKTICDTFGNRTLSAAPCHIDSIPRVMNLPNDYLKTLIDFPLTSYSSLLKQIKDSSD